MKKTIYTLLATVSMIAGLAACNSGGDSNSGTAVAQAIGNCQAGSVYTAQYGCLPQGACPAGYGQYQAAGVQSQCVVASTCGATTGYPTGYNTGYPYGAQTGNCGVGTTGYTGYGVQGYTGYGVQGYTGYTTGYVGGYAGYGGYGGGYGVCAAGFNYMGGMCFNMMNPSIWYRVY